MIKQELEKYIQGVLEGAKESLGIEKVPEVVLGRPENAEHGDYTTNIAFLLAKSAGKNPHEVADMVVEHTRYQIQNTKYIDRIEAVAGFINIHLALSVFEEALHIVLEQKETFGTNATLQGKRIMVEYAHPNTHKEMHIGHMRTLITGEALCRMLEACGATVFRANYQGDIGPHVAKSIWGTQQLLQERGMSLEDANKLSFVEKAHLLGEGYVKGNQEYEANKQEIDELNAKLYQRDERVLETYETTRGWSLGYYEEFYQRFGTTFDKLYFESEVAQAGKEIVRQHVGKVFQESDGAIVFKGEQYGLHTRVFITQNGNPTYEGKEMGLAPLQYKDFPFDKNIHVVANEQTGYFQVVIQALELIDEKFKGKEYHLPMGMVQLVGKKMSSRTGVVVTVDSLLDDVKQEFANLITSEGFMESELEEVKETGTIAAVKYSVLKTDTKANVLFDLATSVALDGNSGPYLLYTYARCKSILRKAQEVRNKKQEVGDNFTKEEYDILRTLYTFPEVVQEAAQRYAPHLVCTYAFALAQQYNSFYNAHSVLQADTPEQQEFRLQLTTAVAHVLNNSLSLLGIPSLDRM